MAMNVNSALSAYSNYRHDYRTAKAFEKKEDTAKTTESGSTQKESATSIGEKNLSTVAQKLLKDLRSSGTNMDFFVADTQNGDNAKDLLARSDKEFTVIFSKEEIEKMASDPDYYAEKMQSLQGALRMSEEINAQFGFEGAFGKTNEIGSDITGNMTGSMTGNTPSSMTDDMLGNMGITKFGISFNSDRSTTFFAQLEKLSAAQKDHTEKLQQKKATVQAASMEDLLEKIKNIDWNAIKAEEPPVGSRMDYSV